MRRFLFSAVVAIALVFAVVPTAVADTGEPEVGDLGLDGITISRLAVLKSGDVRVAGTIQCSEDLEWVEVQFALRQDVGRFHTVFGYGWDETACSADVGSATFSVIVEPDQGRFGPNRAQFEGGAYVEQCWWGPDEEDEICVWDEAWIGPTVMKVRRGR
jgi:hypothetical protein